MKKNKFYTIVILFIPLFLFAVFFYSNVTKSKVINDGIDEIEVPTGINNLIDDTYEGRQTGTLGGEKASEYIKKVLNDQGIQSAGGDEYGHSFDATTAIVESTEFKLGDIDAGFDNILEIYKDYNPETKGLGGSIDYTGDILLAVGPIEDIPEDMLVGRVVAVKAKNLTYEAKIHVLRSGGQGILYYDDGKTDGFEIEKKSVDASEKRIESIFVARITQEVYGKLIDGAEDGVFGGAKIHVKIGFPYVACENIIAYIPAPQSMEYLIIATGYDGYGRYGENGYVPGAIDNASGVSGLLELSEKLSESNLVPRKNIVFIFLDGEKTGAAGIAEYIENPLFPLEKSEFLFLDKLGWKDSNKTELAYYAGSNSSEKLAERINQNHSSQNSFFHVDLSDVEDEYLEGSLKVLSEAGVTAVRLASASREEFNGIAATLKDNRGQLNQAVLTENLSVCLDFIEADCYDISRLGYIDMRTSVFGLIFIALLYIAFALYTINRRHPGAHFGSKSIGRLYFSTPCILAERILSFSMIALIIILLTAFASNLQFLDSMSFHGICEKIYSFIVNVRIEDFYNILDGKFALSVGIATASAVITFVMGIIVGMNHGTMRRKKMEGKGILSLIVLSVPQAFVTLGLLYISTIYIVVNKLDGGAWVLGFKSLTLPIISMIIVPFVWFSGEVSRLASVEMDKDYVFLAKARGFTKTSISRHVFKGVLINSLNYIPKLMVVVLSNLIVVEYIFGLPGIMNRLLLEMNNPQTVFPAMILIGAVYIIFALLTKALLALLNSKGGY